MENIYALQPQTSMKNINPYKNNTTMNRTSPILILPLLALGMSAAAQVHVQPVDKLSRVIVMENARLTVECASETRIESDTPDAVARKLGDQLIFDANNTALLRFNAASEPVYFIAEGGSSITFRGRCNFGEIPLNIHTKDNARVQFTSNKTDTLHAASINMVAEDNANITGSIPMRTRNYKLHAEDNSCIDLDDLKAEDSYDSTQRHEITILDNGRINVHRGIGKLSVRPNNKKNKARRHFETEYTGGWNNWGSRPLAGLGGMDNDAAVDFRFGHMDFTFSVPVLNSRHYGLYVGLGVETDIYRFEKPIVDYVKPGFTASPAPSIATVAGSNPDSWSTFLYTNAITIPITFSYEPWSYKTFCVRLSAIPGVRLNDGGLTQTYRSTSVSVSANDLTSRKQTNRFMLDARLAVYYKSIGIYLQTATAPMLKSGNDKLFPVSLGFLWVITGR